MKSILISIVAMSLIISCSTYSKKLTSKIQKIPEESVRIANDSLSYEIIITDLGFNTYLNTIAKPANFYSQDYYETKNKFYVAEWNYRARNHFSYDNFIYEMPIDYDFNTNYGLDVNYKLYNYFKFVEYKYHQKF